MKSIDHEKFIKSNINQILLEHGFDMRKSDVSSILKFHPHIYDRLLTWSRFYVTVNNVVSLYNVFSELDIVGTEEEWIEEKAHVFQDEISSGSSVTFTLSQLSDQAETVFESCLHESLHEFSEGNEGFLLRLLPYLDEMYTLDYTNSDLSKAIQSWYAEQDPLNKFLYAKMLWLLPQKAAERVARDLDFHYVRLSQTISKLNSNEKTFYVHVEGSDDGWIPVNVNKIKNKLEQIFELYELIRQFRKSNSMIIFIVTDEPRTANSGFIIKVNTIGNITKIQEYNSPFVNIRFLGAGSFGDVDLVKRKQDGVFLIRKIAKKEATSNALEALNFETHILKKLRLRNNDMCTTLISCFHESLYNPIDQSYELLMRVNSPNVMTFEQLMLAEEDTSLIDKIKIMYDLMRAVQFVHDAEIAHRDLSPKNIIIYDYCRVYLIDFGLACSVHCMNNQRCITETGNRPFIAPEMHELQWSGRMIKVESVSSVIAMKCDWYSVGYLLNELFLKKHMKPMNQKESDCFDVISILKRDYMNLKPEWVNHQIITLSDMLRSDGSRISERIDTRRQFPIIEKTPNPYNIIFEA